LPAAHCEQPKGYEMQPNVLTLVDRWRRGANGIGIEAVGCQLLDRRPTANYLATIPRAAGAA
jgi:hypothetical protein